MRLSMASRVLGGLVLGLALGLVAVVHPTPPLIRLVQIIEPIGTLWVNAIRMTVVPLVFALLVTGVAATEVRTVRALGARALAAFVGLLVVSGTVAMMVAPLLFAWLHVDVRPVATPLPRTAAPGIRDWVLDLVPANPIKAAADGAMLPLVVFTIAFAIALLTIRVDRREPVLGFFRGVSDAMLAIVRFVIALAPIGVFALMLSISSRAGVAAAGALGYYVAAAIAAHAALLVVLYPLAPVVARLSIAHFARAALPPQAVAVSTSSSLASLPALIDSAERRLHLPDDVTGLVLPLAVSSFKLAIPMVWVVAAVFLSKLYAVPLGPAQMLVITVTSMLTSFSAPGVPHGGLLMISPLVASMGLPPEGVGLLIAVDVLPDIGATTVNVTGDLLAAAMVGRTRAGSATVRP